MLPSICSDVCPIQDAHQCHSFLSQTIEKARRKLFCVYTLHCLQCKNWWFRKRENLRMASLRAAEVVHFRKFLSPPTSTWAFKSQGPTTLKASFHNSMSGSNGSFLSIRQVFSFAINEVKYSTACKVANSRKCSYVFSYPSINRECKSNEFVFSDILFSTLAFFKRLI